MLKLPRRALLGQGQGPQKTNLARTLFAYAAVGGLVFVGGMGACASANNSAGDSAGSSSGGPSGGPNEDAGGDGGFISFGDGGDGAGGKPDGAGGGDDAASGADGSVIDASGQEAAAPLPTSIIFVHASPNLEPLRLCWGPNGAVPGSIPFPSDNQMISGNYPGISVGGAVWLNDPVQIASLSGAVLYGVRAHTAAIDFEDCSRVLTPGYGYYLGEDYWRVGTIDPGQLASGTVVIAISGCRYGDMTANVERCGGSWDAVKGNLHLDVVRVQGAGAAGVLGGAGDGGDDAAGDDAGGDDGAGDSSGGNGGIADAGPPPLLVQVAQLSPALQQLQSAGGADAVVSFGKDSTGAQTPVAQLAREGDLLPSAPVGLPFPAAISDYGLLGFSVDVPGLDAGGAAHLWMSLAEAQQLVSPTQDPAAYFGAAVTYVVAVVGDPSAPHAFVAGDGTDGGAYDGTGLHLLVLPSMRP
jgi:hypothetical protein